MLYSVVLILMPLMVFEGSYVTIEIFTRNAVILFLTVSLGCGSLQPHINVDIFECSDLTEKMRGEDGGHDCLYASRASTTLLDVGSFVKV